MVRQATLACDRAERRILGDRYKVPRRMVEQITASARFRALVDRLSGQTGKPRADVERDLESCLSEMAAVQSPPAIDAFRALMGPLHTKAWDVKVDEDGLERLRELNKEHALVFLPSHRSYSDPLLFAEVLHDRDFPRNHVLGGNNLSFWPIGRARPARRDRVHPPQRSATTRSTRLAIQEYLGHLLAKRFNLEWYIEGGRSRTGKLRRRRFGLLRYLVARAGGPAGADDVCWCRSRSSTTSCTRSAPWPPSRRGAGRRPRGWAGWPDYVRAPATPHRHRPGPVRRAVLAARGARARPRRRAGAAREGRVPSLRGINRVTPGDGDLAGHVRAARRAATGR